LLFINKLFGTIDIETIKKYYKDSWRPKDSFYNYQNLTRMEDLLKFITELLLKTGQATIIKNITKIPNDFIVRTAITPDNSYIIDRYHRKSFDLSNKPDHITRTIFPGVKLNTYIFDITGIESKVKSLKTQLVIPKEYQKKEPLVYMHNCYVSRSELNPILKLRSACCKLDIFSHLNDFDFGLAVNGGFFDVNNTFRPIGPYKQFNDSSSYLSTLNIPPLYQQYYAYILIKNNKFTIIPTSFFINSNNSDPLSFSDFTDSLLAQINDADFSFVSGPILVFNKKILFNSDTLNHISLINGNYVDIFQCSKSSLPSTSKYLQYTGGPRYSFTSSGIKPSFSPEPFQVANCDQISPGELAHASNPNPRTALLLYPNGDYSFLVVEGRDQRGSGLDCAQLSFICSSLGCSSAVNLDGGTSSNLAWATSDGYITGISPYKLSEYPVGNILTLTP